MWFDGKIGTRESIKYIQVYVNYFPHSVKIMGIVSLFLKVMVLLGKLNTKEYIWWNIFWRKRRAPLVVWIWTIGTLVQTILSSSTRPKHQNQKLLDCLKLDMAPKICFQFTCNEVDDPSSLLLKLLFCFSVVSKSKPNQFFHFHYILIFPFLHFFFLNKTEKQVFQTLKREHQWGEKSY